MSLEKLSEQDSIPAQSSVYDEHFCLDEWRKNIRACVTALKCHIIASNGLHPEGFITAPYSPEVLIKAYHNDIYMKDVDKDELELYIATAMAKLSPKDGTKDDLILEDVRLSLDENKLMDGPSSSPETSLKGFAASNEQINDTLNDCSQLNHELSNESHSMGAAEDAIDSLKKEESKEVKDIKEQLCEKVGEIERLSKIRDEVENELQDLTANLFQEAHSMVQGANLKAAAAEKACKEAKMQVEVLQAEVAALKTLVITSTPAAPNPHLHPQIVSKGAQVVAEAGKIFQRGHKKSPSDFDLKYGRDTTPPSSPLKDGRLADSAGAGSANGFPLDPECWEVDPVLHREFVAWRQEPDLGRASPFMARVYSEDVDLCLAFPNSTLAHKILRAIEDNLLYIEEVNPRQKSSCPKKCVLLDVPRYCKYRFRLGDEDDTWFYISQLARNRIISVCDFLSYLRYIQRGLVKSSIHDVYWEIVKLRRQMALARLGF